MFSALPTWPARHPALAPISAPSRVIKPLTSIGRVAQSTLDGKHGLSQAEARIHVFADCPLCLPRRKPLPPKGRTVA